ncbi:MAG: endonuclease domain-containing protein [Clostridia bacterium]|nr:endonuclease domain-containing protein [Clostridia bacterium]MBQ7931635.1 endonuclease domain-containing protein [Clostridia bacterium]
MNPYQNPGLTENAKSLRRNMTPEERHLWYDFLRTLPVTINRQKVIGKYIVDFYCAKTKIVIELDGSQHRHEAGMLADMERDDYLRNLGITVLRYSNDSIHNNFGNVCADITQHLEIS